jgi:multiple sugar transport system substrate-binding protein
MARTVRVLGVGDPAVYAYTDETLNILGEWRAQGGGEVSFDIVPWDRYLSTLNLQFEASEPAYDIVMLPGHLWLPEFVEAGRLAPLSRHAAAVPTAEWEDLKPFVRDELSYRGELYLMPSFTDGHVVFYRSDLAGGLPQGTRTTPQALGELARRSDGRGHRGIALKADPSEIFLDWLPYLWAFGGDLLTEDGEPAFATTAGAESLAFYRSLREAAPPDTDSYGNEQIARALRDGTVAMATSWGGQAGFIYAADGGFRGDLRAATFEKPWNVVWSFGVLSAAPDVAAAFEFLRYLSSPAVDAKVGRYAGSPVRSSTYDADRHAVPWYAVQEEMLDRCERLPRHPRMNAILPAVTEKLVAAFSGRAQPGEALSEAADAVRAALG